MSRWKKFFFGVLALFGLAVALPILNKAAPIVRERECYRKYFPKEQFLRKLKEPPPSWMQAQIERDLALFQERGISSDRVEKMYAHLHKKAGYARGNFHYRILDNLLYKFVPEGESFSNTDNRMEKALKTLLLYAKVPDCDFLLCSMDGVPEPYLPRDYYFVEKIEDLAPIFVQAKEEGPSTQHLVLIPDQLSLSELWSIAAEEILKANQKISWAEKAPIAVWRGGLSDAGEPTDGRVPFAYEATPRFTLCALSQLYGSLIDAGFAGLDSKEMEQILQEKGFCKPPLSRRDHLKAKYLPVLDGHMCTYPGFQWRLLSNSVCFKQDSHQVQWFYQALMPYVHYIPLKRDMSDLLEQIDWAKEHDAALQAISERARAFAMQYLMPADDYHYYFLALSEYAKRQTMDFAAIKAETKLDPRWKCIQYRKRVGLQKSFRRILQKVCFLKNDLAS